jgi:hypothetical protein
MPLLVIYNVLMHSHGEESNKLTKFLAFSSELHLPDIKELSSTYRWSGSKTGPQENYLNDQHLVCQMNKTALLQFLTLKHKPLSALVNWKIPNDDTLCLSCTENFKFHHLRDFHNFGTVKIGQTSIRFCLLDILKTILKQLFNILVFHYNSLRHSC